MRRIEDRIDVARYLTTYLGGTLQTGRRMASGEAAINCCFHEDKHASFSINPSTGLWKCHTPNCRGFTGGNLILLVAAIEGLSNKEAAEKILSDCGVEITEEKPAPEELCEDRIQEYHTALLCNSEILETLHIKYLWDNLTIINFKLGWNGSRITIPIYDHLGKLVNIRKKPIDSGHCVGIEFFNQMRLFPIQNLSGEEIFLFEGEKDCMLACQLGLNAMTVTSGAGGFNQEWITLFKEKSVIVCYDVDQAGITGAKRIKEILLNAVKELKIVSLPITSPPNGDFTDYVLQGGNKEKFLELVNQTAPEIKLVAQPTRIPTYVHPVALDEASRAEYYFKRVRFNVVVSGKDTQPYMPPCEIEISCPADQPFCKHCGMAVYGGKFTLKLNELSVDILQWIDCTEETHRVLLRKNLEIPLKCKLWKTFVSKAQTVEEVTLIPEISYASHDTEYVVRTAYVIGKSIKSNCNYQFEAITMPHPANQAATHLIYGITENKTNIDEFKTTDRIREELEMFRV